MADITKESYDAFLSDVLTRVPASLRGEAEQVFKNEVVSSVLRDAVLARSDYSRNMDAYAEQERQFQAEVEEARTRIQGWSDWYGQTAQEVSNISQQAEETKTQLARYQELFGTLEDLGDDGTFNSPPETAQETTMSTGLTQEQVQEIMAQRDQMAIKFADVLTDLKLDHHSRFGERLDTEALIAQATQAGIPLQHAYRDFIAPREQQLAEKTFNERMAAAKEEGRREALTQHHLPVGPPRQEPHVLDAQNVQKDPRDRVSAAVAAFNAGVLR